MQRLLRTSAAPYVVALLVAAVVEQFAHYVSPDGPLLKGQPPAIVLHFVLFAVALVLWFTYRSPVHGGRLFGVFVLVAGVMWLVLMVLGTVDGALFNLTALLYLPVLAMLWWKPPRARDVVTGLDTVSWALIVISVASQVLDLAGVVVMRHEFVLRLPIMTELFGVTTRWEGPFGNVNYAGPIGAFLLVYGCCRLGFGLRRSWQSVLFIAAGIVILIASEARTSWVASAAGIGVLFVFTPRIGRLMIPAWLRWGAAALGLLALVVILVGPDTDLNSRTPVWSAYLTLWQQEPVIGAGESGIMHAVDIGVIPAWAPHAHSVYIDLLVRYGVLGLLLVLATLVVGVYIGTRAALRGSAAGLALLVTFVVGGLTETIVDLRYLSIQGAAMLASVTLAAMTLREGQTEQQPTAASSLRVP